MPPENSGPSPATKAPRIMIVAGEASGDMHGARLVRALKDLAPNASVCGMGGEALRRQGVEILYDAAKMAVVGITEVIGHLGDIRAARRILVERLRRDRPDLLILIDYPDFNLLLARKAKRLGIPIFYYISPQVWAWRSGRVRTIRKLVDRMAVILPFEQEFYRQRGMEVDFVGHPLLDAVHPSLSRHAFLARHGIAPDATVIGLLPGSRRREIATLLPEFLDAARRLAAGRPDLVFLLPLAPGLERSILNEHGLASCELNVQVVSGERYEVMASCDAAVAASGTVTLELAILGVPMVIVYRTALLTYLLGRLLIKVPHASLVNLVAEREVVPELLQEAATGSAIAEHLQALLDDRQAYGAMRQALAEVRARLGGPGASRRAADLVLDLIGQRPPA